MEASRSSVAPPRARAPHIGQMARRSPVDEPLVVSQVTTVQTRRRPSVVVRRRPIVAEFVALSLDTGFESDEGVRSAPVSPRPPSAAPEPPPPQQSPPPCRHIYPNVPYSPCGSPRLQRRPLREVNRVVSIEQDGEYVQLNQYKLRHAIGAGSYGIVKLAHNQDNNTDYAMKILNKRRIMRKGGMFVRGRLAPRRKTSGSAPPANPLDRVYREIAILRKLDHPNVVKLVEVLDDPAEENLYLAFELMTHGAVLDIPTDSPLSEQLGRRYFRDVLLGIEYLHYQKVIHRDIKPSNLLLGDDDHIKIADFGVCNEFTGPDALLTGTSGTPAFLPPESLRVERDHYSGRAADVWSMGVTLYSLVTGQLPFCDDNILSLYQRVQSQPLQFPDDRQLSESLRQLVAGMLERDPQLRLTVPQIRCDAWLTDAGRWPLPSEAENCDAPLYHVTDEEMDNCVRHVPSVSTIILVRAMIKQRSFTNPYRHQQSAPAAHSRSLVGVRPSAAAAAANSGCWREQLKLSQHGRCNSAPSGLLESSIAAAGLNAAATQPSAPPLSPLVEGGDTV